MGTKAIPALVKALLDNPKTAECPVCGETGFWDNRNSPNKGKGPDFKCKNKQCDDGDYGFGVFLPKSKAGTDTPAAKRPSVSWRQIQFAYRECLDFATKEAERIGKKGVPSDMADIAAMTATLLIQRERCNAWPVPAAPKPAPPPPADDDLPYDDEPPESDDPF